jgi:hypothetical protein
MLEPAAARAADVAAHARLPGSRYPDAPESKESRGSRFRVLSLPRLKEDLDCPQTVLRLRACRFSRSARCPSSASTLRSFSAQTGWNDAADLAHAESHNFAWNPEVRTRPRPWRTAK